MGKTLFVGKYIFKLFTVRPYYFMKSRWFIWKPLNAPAMRMQKRDPIPLTDLGEKIVKEVKQNGIYITHIDEVFPDTDWFEKLCRHADGIAPEAKQAKRKPFFIDMWDMNKFLLDIKNPFLTFVLADTILGIANAYLGLYSRLHSLRLMKTRIVAEGTPPEQSQLWHRDNGDKRFLKVFLYLNDVDEDGGPFYYVKGSQPGGKWYSIFPQITPYSPKSPRIPEEALRSVVPEEDIVTCTGRKGTMVFVDTVGMHKGGYSTKRERFTMLGTFYALGSLTGGWKRRKFIFPENFDETLERISPQAAYAIRPM